MAKNEKTKATEEMEEVSCECEAENCEKNPLEEQLKELNDKYLRILAEFDNFKKRTEKEKLAIYSDATAMVIGSILPISDALELASATPCKDEVYKKGVELTLNGLRAVFEKLSVEEINPENQPFDPELHNAVMTVEDESLEPNTVCQVLQKGYKVKDKVIRHAMVKVANA